MLAFIHLQKTGGLTIRNLLRSDFGGKNCDCPIHKGIRVSDWEWVKECYPDLESLHGHSVTPHSSLEEVFENVRYFTMLRDPFARCLSHYQHKHPPSRTALPLNQWLPLYSNLMCKAICDEENAELAIETLEQQKIFVGLTESFDESLILWRRWSGHPHLNLNYITKNKARSSVLKEAVLQLPHAIDLIREYNQEDRKLYDYVLNEIYPRQKTDYGDTLQQDLKEYQRTKSKLPPISLTSISGCIKRRLVYNKGIRDWRVDWMREANRAA
ncbi:MAG: sulfotransferase family 2 domain-containing protein [Planctomycetaceae bacterium]|nr:sulfotransferase family 2 domain-containing protein [Planctomycetaceae bacterium]